MRKVVRMAGFLTVLIALVTGVASAAPSAAPVRRTSTPPAATITSPQDGASYTPGAMVPLAGAALDAEDPDARLTYQWDVDAVGPDRTRMRILSFKGKTATFVPEVTEMPGTTYEIRLVVTDPARLRDTVVVHLVPDTTRSVDDASYPLGPGDEVHVAIYAGGEKQEDFSGEVSPAGTLTSPLIGEIPVGGITASKLSNRMRDILARDYFVDPQVLVTVKEQARKVYVSGEVKNPGAYSVQEGLTVLSVCTLAGGFSDYAAVNRVKVLRTENGATRSIDIDLSKVRRGKRPDMIVMAGDRIDVPHRRY